MKTEVAKNALIFLGRVDLKGAETEAFNEVVRELRTYLPVPEEPSTGTVVEDKKEEEKTE